jgi:predicted phage tail protein
MLREIKLYGQLAKFVGHRKLKAAVSSAGEAVRFLLVNFPGLDRHMAEHNYKVLAGDYALGIEELHDPAGMQTIKIVPVVAGAGGSVTKILVGVALVAAAIVFAPAAAGFLGAGLGATAGTFTLGAAASVAIGAIGTSLILGGVAQALSPTPKAGALNTVGGIGIGGIGGGGGSDPRDSYSFNGVQNVSRQGVPVPIIFGEVICGSVTVSAGIDVAQKKG